MIAEEGKAGRKVGEKWSAKMVPSPAASNSVSSTRLQHRLEALGKLAMSRCPFGVTLVLAGMLLACDDKKQVTALEKHATDLDTEVKALKTTIEALQRDRSWDRLLRDVESTAFLTPGTDGYATIATDLGRITVKLANVQPYANGTRVTLELGNPLNATIDGTKATIEWGSVDQKGSPKNDTARSREVKFAESLRPGAWTNVQIVLEGVPPNDLGFVRIKEMTHSGIKLLR